mgnify:CR=1 FL=1
MIRITDQYFWNIIFMLFYLALATMGIIILESEAHLLYTDLNLLDIVLMALAAQRLIRLFVYDTMTKFFREQFYDAKVTKAGKVTLYKPATGPRRTLCDLMSCPWCFGMWASSTVVFFYMLTPLAYIPVLILAVSTIATMLQNFSRFLYTHSEV